MAQPFPNDLTYTLYSSHLEKKKRFDVYLPERYDLDDEEAYKLVLMNDGQDAPRLKLGETLHYLHHSRLIEDTIWVSIYADEDRMQEYGVAQQVDYAKRGAKANDYTQFIVEELLPFLHKKFLISKKPADTAFIGFSLGGLSAFDIVWHHPQWFGKVGAFSASFWWRSKALGKDYTDKDRIMHNVLSKGKHKNGLQFWFEVGTKDEQNDRNNSGIIDAIEDTLDIIGELEKLGYSGKDIKYVEVQGGEHNPETWSKLIPDFAQWAFPRQTYSHRSGKVFM